MGRKYGPANRSVPRRTGKRAIGDFHWEAPSWPPPTQHATCNSRVHLFLSLAWVSFREVVTAAAAQPLHIYRGMYAKVSSICTPKGDNQAPKFVNKRCVVNSRELSHLKCFLNATKRKIINQV